MAGLARSLYRLVATDQVKLGESILPAAHLRFGGPEFKDDSYFLKSSRLEATRLRDKCGLDAHGSVLDVGCGVGRLPIGLLLEAPTVRYVGVDVDAHSIRWCQKHLERPGFSFRRLDVRNNRYNPRGAELTGGFCFPFADHEFNAIYLYSVFSHMLTADVGSYLKEFRRIIKPSGTLFFTAFVEEGVPNVAENPPDYRMAWNGALHCVRYERRFFESRLHVAGFKLSRFDYGQETDGQSALYCTTS
jgi:SAM-dependent methyltransferase